MDALDDSDVVEDVDGNVAVHGKTLAVWTSKIPEEGRDELLEVERP